MKEEEIKEKLKEIEKEMILIFQEYSKAMDILYKKINSLKNSL